MKKKFLAICLSLVVAIALLVVFVPSCTGGRTGTIEVYATLCGEVWEGDVSYNLTGPGATAPTVITGTNVADNFTVDVGEWSCEYVSGGPDGAYFDGYTPTPPTQTVSENQEIIFTLNFELDQDAWIKFETWTINGIPIEEYEWAWWEDGYWYAEVEWCNVIDVEYTQGVDGCEERQVTLNETDELEIHYVYGDPLEPPIPEEIQVHVLNDSCAVNKTVEPEGPDAEKLGQVPSYEGEPAEEGEFYPLPMCTNMTLDVETSWQLVKCLNYTKSINWLHIGGSEPPSCFLFDLASPGWGTYGIEMRSRASVELVDDVDADPENNSTDWCTPLRLYVYFYPF